MASKRRAALKRKIMFVSHIVSREHSSPQISQTSKKRRGKEHEYLPRRVEKLSPEWNKRTNERDQYNYEPGDVCK
jgi:hypothetical protein